MTSVCRVCLAGNVKLLSLENVLHIDVYEKLSNTKLNEAGRPRAACCYCYQKLLRCHTFSVMARRSEKVIGELFIKGFEVTHETITKLNLQIKQNLAVTSMYFTENENYLAEDVKEENNVADNVAEEIKYEKDAEEDELEDTVNSCFTEEYIKLHMKLEEDSENDIKYSLSETVNDTPVDSCMKYECDDCAKIFLVKSKLISHIRKLHSKKTGNAEPPNATTSKSRWITHRRTSEKPLSCNICLKYFSQKNKLRIHMKIHTIGLKNNLAEHGSHTEEEIYACDLCSKLYKEKKYLSRHMRIHYRHKPFACDSCDAKFSTMSTLGTHRKIIHTGEKPFACDICDEQFSYKMSLITHKRSHTVEKSFACDICYQMFTENAILIAHRKIHTGENSYYACGLCDKQFTYKCSMLRHRSIHAGIKYLCEICGKQFNDKFNLLKHLRTHTGEKPYACCKCEKQFSQRYSLARHCMLIHDEENLSLEPVNAGGKPNT